MQVTSFDGVRLAVTETGSGPPLLLLHGLFSSAATNWQRYGTADALAGAGWRVVMPDFRGHGASEAPVHPDAWPPDVLARDAEAVIEALGLGDDLVLGGYSLGARTVVRLLDRGLRPRAAILAGMGLAGIEDPAPRGQWFVRMIRGRGQWPRGSGEYLAQRFMAASVPEPDALVPLLERQVATPAARLSTFELPILVVAGAEDRDNGSAADLARALPRAVFREIPGNHMGTVTRPELAGAMVEFLDGLDPS